MQMMIFSVLLIEEPTITIFILFDPVTFLIIIPMECSCISKDY